jgi:hypothetical protein
MVAAVIPIAGAADDDEMYARYRYKKFMSVSMMFIKARFTC